MEKEVKITREFSFIPDPKHDNRVKEIRHYWNEKLIARYGSVYDENGNCIGVRELRVKDVIPLSLFEKVKKSIWKRPERLDYLNWIGLINYIGTVNTINKVKTIEEILNIKKVEEITEIKNIQSMETVLKVRGLHWYDRNPITESRYYGGDDVAPHGATQRWTYTVPVGKKAFLETLFCSVDRRSVADTVGRAESWISYLPSGGVTMILIEAKIWTNVVGDKDHIALADAGCLLAGDKIRGFTIDMSADGTIDYNVTAKITEFDA